MRNVLLTVDFILRVPDGKTIDEQERWLKATLNRALPKNLVFDFTLKDRTFLIFDPPAPASEQEFTPCIRCKVNTDLACNECGNPCCVEHGEMIDGEWYCADIPASV